jgi:hypothetical protein
LKSTLDECDESVGDPEDPPNRLMLADVKVLRHHADYAVCSALDFWRVQTEKCTNAADESCPAQATLMAPTLVSDVSLHTLIMDNPLKKRVISDLKSLTAVIDTVKDTLCMSKLINLGIVWLGRRATRTMSS